MSLIRKLAMGLRSTRWAALALVAAGCSHSKPPRNEPLNSSPLVIDGAMQRRDWSRSVASYGNGSVKGYATRFNYEPSARRPEWAGPVVEPVVFIGETLLAPVTFVTTPLFRPVTYPGLQFEPTYNAMPALPPSVGEQGGEPGIQNRGPAGTVTPGNQPAPGASGSGAGAGTP